MQTAVTEAPPEGEDVEAPLKVDFKKLFLILAVGIGVALLLVRLVGEREAVRLLGSAHTGFVALAVLAESLRYVAVALYTQKLLHFLGRHIPLWPFLELMFAGGSANRIVSAGGVAGIYVRYRFFDKHGLSMGNLAVVLILQNIMTGVILFTTLCLGLLYLLSRRLLGMEQFLVAAAMLCLMLGLFVASIVLYRRPAQLKRALDRLSQTVAAPINKVTGRSLYNPDGLATGIDNFYKAVEVARSKPLETGKALIYGLLTLFSDIASLYFVFRALGFAISFDVLVVGYVVTNYVISLLLMPEGIGITEVSLATVYTSLGVPSAMVVVATLLFRFIAFWLPIGVGLVALWHLRRRAFI